MAGGTVHAVTGGMAPVDGRLVRAPLLDPSGVRRIVVFRALVLGDLLCAVPAWRALRCAHPDAEITLVSLPWASELAARLSCFDRFVPFPGFPGLPERAPDLSALPAFLRDMQRREFDLALQMHGSGQVVNPLVAAFGARHSAGYAIAGQYCPEPPLFMSWPERGHEIDRMLRLTDHLGLERRGTHLEFPLAPADLAWRDAAGFSEGSYVCVHPGAQLPSRRWPLDRFAAVVKLLDRQGWRVVVTGTAAESELARALVEQCSAVTDMTGRTTLWQFGALVGGAALVVANDTGISHVAAALGTPSVIVSCGSEPERWAPLDARRHRVLAAPAPCRPCAHATCPTAHECALGTSVEAVLQTAESMLEPSHV
jgi:ADP-heptose:LPS heptosyltransferase